MCITRRHIALVVACYCARTFAADGDFYRLFQTAVTNSYRPSQSSATNGELVELDSPLLVDTNNTGFKLTTTLLHLEALQANGRPSGIRLGMTMEDIVAHWGKPLHIDPQCLGYPHFLYSDAHVYFEPSSNSVKAIHGVIPDLARTLPAWPTTEDCIRKIGPPSRREYYADGTHCYLISGNPERRIRLLCAFGKLVTIEWGRDPSK